jgi:hypothetical protein
MLTRSIARWLLVGLALVFLPSAPGQVLKRPSPLKDVLKGGIDLSLAYTLSGPYTKANLSFYLVHGKDTLAGKPVVTLAEALNKKLLVVHETKAQNQLRVENVSADVEVFIQAGDIVKGGQQDRVMAYDLLVEAGSRWTVGVYCVEQGRWQQRGAESAIRFESSTQFVVGKSLKLAINSSHDQKLVWQGVIEAQKKLEVKLGQSVQSRQSPTSLQLTLETKGLQERTEPYLKELTKIIDDQKDVVGCIVCVNGKIDGAEVYGSSELFRKMWPRLVRSAAVSAVTEFEAAREYPPVPKLVARAFLAEARLTNQAQVRDMVKRLQIATLDTSRLFMVETRDHSAKGAMVHFSVVVK